MLYLAGVRIAHNLMTLGDLFFGMIGAVGVVTPAARSISGFNTMSNEALAAVTRIFTLIDEPETINDKPGQTPNVAAGRIEFSGVGFQLWRRPCGWNVSFVVEPGRPLRWLAHPARASPPFFNLPRSTTN